VKHVTGEIIGLVEELQHAQQEFEAVAASRNFENQSLLRVLKFELINHLRITAEHVAHLRWMIRQAAGKHSDGDPATLSLNEHNGSSLVEHVDAIVTAALADKPLLRS
jgi:hypothetical protein